MCCRAVRACAPPQACTRDQLLHLCTALLFLGFPSFARLLKAPLLDEQVNPLPVVPARAIKGRVRNAGWDTSWRAEAEPGAPHCRFPTFRHSIRSGVKLILEATQRAC